MKELTIINQNGQLLIDSRDVAEMIERDHSNLMRDIRGYAETLNSPNSNLKAANFFIESTYLDKQNQIRPCYLLARKGCDMVANKMTGEKGVLFTAAYVTRFEEMEASLKQFAIPKTYAEALRQLADSWEENQKLIVDNAIMQPKAEFFDAVAESKDAIDIGSAAKVLNMGIGRNNLFEMLRNKGILMQNNQPYQRYIDLGYFRMIEQKYNKPDGSTHISIKTLVYQKGLDYIRNAIREDKKVIGT